MERGLIIKWKSKAKNALKRIDKWYRKHMGNKAADKFSYGVLNTVDLLALNPLMGQIEPKREKTTKCYRSFVEHRNHKIIYYIENDSILIADIWPNCQNPEDIGKGLK